MSNIFFISKLTEGIVLFRVNHNFCLLSQTLNHINLVSLNTTSHVLLASSSPTGAILHLHSWTIFSVNSTYSQFHTNTTAVALLSASGSSSYYPTGFPIQIQIHSNWIYATPRNPFLIHPIIRFPNTFVLNETLLKRSFCFGLCGLRQPDPKFNLVSLTRGSACE